MGTVGCATVAILRRNADEITRRAGRRIEITHACAQDINKERPIDLDGITLTADPFELIQHDSLDIVVELIGGVSPAHELAMAAIGTGKHVVTANKALIALYGNEIFKAAHKNDVMVAFEAAVAGGIPIIKAIREGLSGNHIQWIAGIINGTCNFILTEMYRHGSSFDDALGRAQMLGYAETDPTFDIEGMDAAHKLTILASLAFGIPLQFDKVYTEGITKLSNQDIRYADELGYKLKHLGITRRKPEGVELRVHPALVPKSRLLASVEGVMNAIVITGDAVGPTLFYGAGAGGEPTASAVVADLVDVVRTMTADPQQRVPHLAFQPGSLSDTPIIDIADIVTPYYLRLTVIDRPGVLAKVTRIFAGFDISIEAILQKEPATESDPVPVILLTQRVCERDINHAISEIEGLEEVVQKIVRIRVELLK